MFIVYFALWVVLNGRWTLEIGAFGLVFAALLYAFSCRFMGYSVGMDLRLARRVLSAVRYGVLLLVEILKANMNVMRIILNRDFEPRPQLVRFSSGLKRDYHRVVLADSITLTPGTITCMLEGDDFVVHCLDASMMDGLDDGDMPRALHRMETDRLAAMDKDAALPEDVSEGDVPAGEAADGTPAADGEVETGAAHESAPEENAPEAADAEEAAPEVEQTAETEERR